MAASHRFLKLCRQWHLDIGVFTAPALLFFAVTGGLQAFNLHETTRGSSYAPPHWLVVAAQLHKKQTVDVPQRKPRPPVAASETRREPAPAALAGTTVAKAPAAATHHPLPLKIFSAFVGLTLALSTLTGLYMAWRYTRQPRRLVVLVLAGTVLPVVLACL